MIGGLLQGDALPDSLRAGLAVVFVGTAAGARSAAAGAYYAHPGNRFWPTLAQTGITARQFEHHEFALLLGLGIGFTDVAKRAAGMDHQIARDAFVPSGLAKKIATFHPRIVAFTSKRAASFWFSRPTSKIAFGLQHGIDPANPAVFVLPSPSGAASRYWSVEPWHDLAVFIGRTGGLCAR